MKYLENPVRGRIITLGISAGMVFLTKPEVSLAAFTAVIIGFLIAVYSENISYRTFAKKILWFVLSLGIPPLSFFIYFSFHMSMVNALKATLGQWAYVVGYPSFRNLPYYQWVRGTDFLWQNISTIFFYGFIFTITAALAFFINHKLRQFSGNINLLNFLLFLLVIGTLQYFSSSIPLLELLRPLPLFMIGFGVYLIVMIKKNFRNRASYRERRRWKSSEPNQERTVKVERPTLNADDERLIANRSSLTGLIPACPPWPAPTE
ncbi:hypothetical protein IID10_22260 [candidate division KSB1 bacterium]|nr:hypothetical protein [candidate division KSB1 bacterium]